MNSAEQQNLSVESARAPSPEADGQTADREPSPSTREGPEALSRDTFLKTGASDGDVAEVDADAAGVRDPSAVGTTPPDRTFLYGALFFALLLLFGWVGGTAVWEMRRELRDLSARFDALQVRTQASENAQAKAGLMRVRGELQALRHILPESLAEKTAEAERILNGVAAGLPETP